jgi:hypothetical protein
MNPKNGKRKFTAFIITISCFTGMMIFCLCKIDLLRFDLSSFAVQLATGYSIICGLFFGSNVLEHFANRDNKSNSGENV